MLEISTLFPTGNWDNSTWISHRTQKSDRAHASFQSTQWMKVTRSAEPPVHQATLQLKGQRHRMWDYEQSVTVTENVAKSLTNSSSHGRYWCGLLIDRSWAFEGVGRPSITHWVSQLAVGSLTQGCKNQTQTQTDHVSLVSYTAGNWVVNKHNSWTQSSYVPSPMPIYQCLSTDAFKISSV